jgi:hypothetical protein
VNRGPCLQYAANWTSTAPSSTAICPAKVSHTLTFLAKICDHFSVDARILLEPLSELVKTDMANILGSELGDFFDPRRSVVTLDNFPSGFYRFTRKSFVDPNLYVKGLILIYRHGSLTFACGLEAKSAFVQ